MQGIRHGDYLVYLYGTTLHSVSPILKELYCESHRLEPWAVEGIARRVGHYPFPNILYLEAEARDALLARIPRLLAERPEYATSVASRFHECARRLDGHLHRAARGEGNRENVAGLLDETGRILSCGIFKEVFEYQHALEFLASYMPVAGLRDRVLALYQPMCLPHFLKYEAKLLFYSAQFCREQDPAWVTRCIRHAAHFTRFLVEDTPFDQPDTMRAEMERVSAECGHDPATILARRQALLVNHRRARRDALLAERDILQTLDGHARHTLETVLVVKGSLKFIQFIATFEELKHVYAVRTARVLNVLLKERGLVVGDTTRGALLAALAACPASSPAPDRQLRGETGEPPVRGRR